MAKLAQLPANDRAPETADANARRVPRLQPRYFAFLSYSHKDKELADWLHRELERFRVPRALAGRLTENGIVPRRLTPIFRDEHDLAAAGDLGGEIKAALGVSQYLIVLCSPTAAVSRWTNAEVEWFKRDRPEGCILAAIAAGEPFASEVEGREKEECFPPALRQKYDRRGRPTGKRAEPLAADFRVDGEARRTGFLKLVAGMLGVGLDELVQRETTRRNRRLGYLAAASLGGMAVTSTLAVTAFQARNAAREQRREAESLVEFMVGDLRGKLEPIGKLDVLDGVGSRVLAYYKKQDTSELSDEALLQRSGALNLMGKVAFLRGRLDEAEGLYRQAMAGTAEAVRRSPNDTKRIFDHAQNVFWLGEIARARGHKNEAEARYREYRRLGDALVAMEPDNLKWRMESLYGRENVGIALYNERRFAEAAQQFESAIGPMQNLISIDPRNQTYQNELATVLAWAADAQRSLGNLDRAISHRQEQIAVLNRAIAGGATDVRVRQSLIPAHAALGILLAWRGQLDNSIMELRSAIGQADALIPIEPGNMLWTEYSANARLVLAQSLVARGKLDEAARQTSQGCAAVAQLRRRDNLDAYLVSLQTLCLTLRSRLALLSGVATQALALAQQALASARAEHSGDTIKDRYAIGSASRLVGDVHMKAGDPQAAKAAWAAGITVLPPNVTEGPWEMQERADLLRRLDRGDEARSIEQRLAAIGYHSIT
jgi:eukaryotic-like serine/threonine-protein kinase